MMRPLHALLALLVLAAVACWPEARQEQICETAWGPASIEPDAASCHLFTATVEGSALAIRTSLGLHLGAHVDVSLAPATDGSAWLWDNGKDAYAGSVCAPYAVTQMASMDWTDRRARRLLCHELGHVALGCVDRDADHVVMELTGFEAECAAGVDTVHLPTGAFSGEGP